MDKIPQEQHGFNASQDARDPNVPQRTHDQDTPAAPSSSTPDTRSHDELFTEFMREHASPEKEAAALQEHIERESAVLREFLRPAPALPQQAAQPPQTEQDSRAHRKPKPNVGRMRTPQDQQGEKHDVAGVAHDPEEAHPAEVYPNQQQEQQQQGRRYEAQPQQQQMQQQSEQQAPPSYTVAPAPTSAPTPKRKPKAERSGYGVTANIHLPDRTWLRVFTGNDDPVYQWLAAERQVTEQRAMELRAIIRTWGQAAYQQLGECHPMDDHNDKPCYQVPVEFFRFAEASAELVGVETHLRTLGVNPQQSGITQEVWDLFHEAVVDAQTDEGDEEEGE